MNQEITVSLVPYPGLRSFRKDEYDIFFGRDDHVDSMIDKLQDAHFLCVTGPSGCGKSSLTRTGLLNGLEAGFLRGRGSDWIVCDFRPGNNPLENLLRTLATAIASGSALDGEEAVSENFEDQVYQLFRDHIERKSNDLTDALKAINRVAKRPTLILVDQFEELFRHAQSDPGSAVTFVDILLQSAQAKNDIFVAITIRTDELEKCARYSGLTRAINQSQFLTPTLDRYQIQEAIEGPIALFGGSIDPKFSIWLLNSLDEELDKLPLLQHALKLLYAHKMRGQETGEVSIRLEDFVEVFDLDKDIDFSLSESRFALRDSLSKQLDRTYDDLPNALKPAAAQAFCALTVMESHGRDIRRPLEMGELARTIGQTIENTHLIVKHFTSGPEAYLYLKSGKEIDENDIVDVTHECVLRLWKRLQNNWLEKERNSSENIKLLADRAKDYWASRDHKSYFDHVFDTNVLRGHALDRYANWFSPKKHNATWAKRYLTKLQWPKSALNPLENFLSPGEIHKNICTFLQVSKRQRINYRAVLGGIGVLLIFAPIAFFYSWSQTEVAKADVAIAEAQAAELKADAAIAEAKAAKNLSVLKELQVRQLSVAISSADIKPGTGDPIKNTIQLIKTLAEAEQVAGIEKLEKQAYSNLWLSLSYTNELYRYSHGNKGRDARVFAADFMINGDYFLTLNSGGLIRKWAIDKPDAAVREFKLPLDQSSRRRPEGRSLKVSPAGNIAVAGFRDGSVIILDIAQGKSRQLTVEDAAKPHRASVLDIAFSSDGSQLATISHGGNLVVWLRKQAFGTVQSGEGEGENLVWIKNFEFKWKDFYHNSPALQEEDRNDIRKFRAWQIWSVDISRDNKTIAFGLGNGRICVLKNDTAAIPNCSKEGHTSGLPVRSIKFQPNASVLVSAGVDEKATIWQLNNNPETGVYVESTGIFMYSGGGKIWDIDFSVDGRLLAIASADGSIRLYEAVSWRPLGTMIGHHAPVRSIRFKRSAGSTPLLLSASIDRTTRIWTPFHVWFDVRNLSYRFPKLAINAPPHLVRSIAFGPNAEWVAFSDRKNVWIKTAGKSLERLSSDLTEYRSQSDGMQYSQLVSHHKKQILAVSSLRSWVTFGKKSATGRWTSKSFKLAGDDVKLKRAMAINPTGTTMAVTIASNAENAAWIYLCPLIDKQLTDACSRRNGQTVLRIPFEDPQSTGGCNNSRLNYPLALKFSHNGSMLAVGGTDCTLRIYNTKTGALIGKPITGHVGEVYSVGFSPDDKTLVSASNDWTARTWSIETQEQIHQMNHKGAVWRAAFSPSGQSIISVSDDKIAKVWDFESGRRNVALSGFSGGILGLDVIQGPKAALVATSTEDGVVRVFRIFESNDEIANFTKQALGKNMNLPAFR